MRKTLSIAMVTGLAFTFPAHANDEHHPDQKKSASMPSETKDAKDPQNLSHATPNSVSTPGQSGMPTGMMANMEKMQQQMEKIRASTDPKERQKLMQEHMQTMQENMKAMRAMGGPMMMGSEQRGGMAMSTGKDMAGGDMMKHHEMMEKRMDMMQMMMEQMMLHQNAQESVSAPK